VLSIYHTKFYLKIRTGSQVILTLFLGFGRSPRGSNPLANFNTFLVLLKKVSSNNSGHITIGNMVFKLKRHGWLSLDFTSGLALQVPSG